MSWEALTSGLIGAVIGSVATLVAVKAQLSTALKMHEEAIVQQNAILEKTFTHNFELARYDREQRYKESLLQELKRLMQSSKSNIYSTGHNLRNSLASKIAGIGKAEIISELEDYSSGASSFIREYSRIVNNFKFIPDLHGKFMGLTRFQGSFFESVNDLKDCVEKLSETANANDVNVLIKDRLEKFSDEVDAFNGWINNVEDEANKELGKIISSNDEQ